MKVSIIGTAGIPARYGGFETLAENLARYHCSKNLNCELFVYCSSRSSEFQDDLFQNAKLIYVGLKPNGIQSVLYDAACLLKAAVGKSDVIFVLGVSGALLIPFVKLFFGPKVYTNIDGIEWKRDKWGPIARFFLKVSEWAAVRFSDLVISDNQGIQDYVLQAYHKESCQIPYGGDHAVSVRRESLEGLYDVPPGYVFGLCRIEPENNVDMILKAFSDNDKVPLVFVGNWNNSIFGRRLKNKYSCVQHIKLVDPIYNLAVLHSLRADARFYVHGHSAGGTNPSLVEMMFIGCPILAFDCSYNRYTTENKGQYFSSHQSLSLMLAHLDDPSSRRLLESQGEELLKVARRRYRWELIGKKYFELAGLE